LAYTEDIIEFIYHTRMPPETNPFSAPEQSSKLIIVVAVLGVALVAAASVFFYMQQQAGAPASPEVPVSTVPTEPLPIEAAAPESLGGALYDKAANPLSDKLPTETTVTNPIDSAYKNPF
jgi:hypothetical protein